MSPERGRGPRTRVGSWIRGLTGANEAAELLERTEALRAEVGDLAARAERHDELPALLDAVTARLDELSATVGHVAALAEIDLERRRAELDDLPGLRARLEAARARPDHAAAFDEPEPLVTVRIASYRRTRQLVEVALPSVLSQTYTNLEVVVVNDGPNPRTREALEALGEPRVRYDELPERGDYPQHPQSRWQVAGTPAGNRGLDLARGRWIAPLDEDDEFTPDHVERLLGLAREHRAELAYGAVVQRNLVTGDEQLIWSDPPEDGRFALQSAIYHRALAEFRYEPLAWTLNEPGDWNLTRRMLRAGARTACTKEVVGHLNWVPVDHKATHPWSAPS